MLTEQEIQQALHASRVVPLSVANPHGPLGLEQVAAAVSRLTAALPEPGGAQIRRPIALSVQSWEKLEQLAHDATQSSPRPLSASEVATAIIEQYLGTGGSPYE